MPLCGASRRKYCSRRCTFKAANQRKKLKKTKTNDQPSYQNAHRLFHKPKEKAWYNMPGLRISQTG